MSVAAYPSELPRPKRQGYSFAFGDGRFPVRNDTGPRSTRRRFSAVDDTVAMSTNLSRAELGRFERWFVDEVERGSKPFTMRDPATDGWPLLDTDGTPLLDTDGTPLLNAAVWLAQFGELPSIAVSGVRFDVSFTIWVLPT